MSASQHLRPAVATTAGGGTTTAATTEATTRTSSTKASHLIISASDKAGMEGIDRSRIDAIILRESGNSAYIQQQRKRDEAVNVKIDALRKKLRQHVSANGPNWRSDTEGSLRNTVDQLLSTRNTSMTKVVVDMDSFFISCELLSRQERLRHLPCCVGTTMISTSNYAARRYGVRSAMAGFIADKLVEELSGGTQKLIHLPSNFGLYKQKSREVCQVLREYDPHLRCDTLDEAYMDLGPYFEYRIKRRWSHERTAAKLATEAKTNFDGVEEKTGDDNGTGGEGSELSCEDDDNGDEDDNNSYDNRIHPQHCDPCLPPPITPAEILHEMRQKVHNTTGLTCSAGLASNHMLAKIASDINKPNGQLLVEPTHEDIMNFVRPLPVRKVPGVGRVMEKTLDAFGITTVADLFNERALIRILFSPISSTFLLKRSLGWADDNGLSADVDEAGTKDGGKIEEKMGGSATSGLAVSSESSASARQKGMSRERTFSSRDSWTELNIMLENITRTLADDMRKKSIKARTLTLKVKLDTFDVLSRCRSLPTADERSPSYYEGGDHLQLMLDSAAELLQEVKAKHGKKKFSVRLLGVRCSNFVSKEEGRQRRGQQKSLDDMFLSRNKGRSGDIVQAQPQRPSPAPSRVLPSTAAGPLTSVVTPPTTLLVTEGEKASRHAMIRSPYRRQPKDCHGSGCGEQDKVGGRMDQSTLLKRPPAMSTPHCFTEDAKSSPCDHGANLESSHVPAEATSSQLPLASEPKTTMQCPLCQRMFSPNTPNRDVNDHIDACLNGPVLRDLVRSGQEQHRHTTPALESSVPANGRKRLLTQFFDVPRKRASESSKREFEHVDG